LGIIGLVITALLIFFCCKTKDKSLLINTTKKKNENKLCYIDQNNDRRSSTSSIQSFQQLYFSKTPYDQIKNLEQRNIQRWSSAEQPSMTFYRYEKFLLNLNLQLYF
jgi:hypothetical protein